MMGTLEEPPTFLIATLSAFISVFVLLFLQQYQPTHKLWDVTLVKHLVKLSTSCLRTALLVQGRNESCG